MNPVPSNIRLQDAQTLAQGYSKSFRWLEISAIVVFGVSVVGLWIRLWPYAKASPWLTLTAVLCAYLGADFISGVVHWLADTWGTTDMPIIGNALIRPFREHHVDQEAITHHDFVETNGANCLVSMVGVAGSFFCPLSGHGGYFSAAFFASLVVWVFATNQFHKWSHLRTPPRVIGWLQKLHLILPPTHHSLHHAAPFNKYYCITVGWMNWPLTQIRFFRALEWLGTAIFGALPRQDDIGEDAARQIAPMVADASTGVVAEPTRSMP